MPNIDLITSVHTSTKRDYVARVIEHDKASCAEVACQFGADYWDGDRKFGYGGNYYDGRWKPVAERLITQYSLTTTSSVLDVGCGKGFLLYEIMSLVPGITVSGIDISDYAIKHAKEEVKPFLRQGNAIELPYETKSYDLVISLNVIHNLYNYERRRMLTELQRVTKKHGYLVTEAYRTEKEKMNLMYWQLTCRAFHTPKEWEHEFGEAAYEGDYGFIYFE